jgi:hypothetical protein
VETPVICFFGWFAFGFSQNQDSWDSWIFGLAVMTEGNPANLSLVVATRYDLDSYSNKVVAGRSDKRGILYLSINARKKAVSDLLEAEMMAMKAILARV